MPNLRTCVVAAIPLTFAALVACGSSKNNSTTSTAPGDDDDDSGTQVTSPGGSDASSDATLTSTSGNDSGTTTTNPGDAAVNPNRCTKNTDCPSGICNPTGKCAAPSCRDGKQDQDETDIDCGGTICKACGDQKKCANPSDCQSGVCTNDVCQAPTDTDGVKNGTETGTDCGGSGNPQCPVGQGCAGASDCLTDVCSSGTCAANICTDGVKNGNETDVDCGGSDCPRCPDNDTCKLATDCRDDVCALASGVLRCSPASYSDGVQNGNETGVDCGGSGNPANHGCAPAQPCVFDTDCASDACSAKGLCVWHRSCTGKSTGGMHGANTCGSGGDGSIGTQAWEDCCTTVDVTVSEGTPKSTTTVHMDKYKVTAGRMRAFIESVNGDVATFIGQARAAGKIPVLPVPSTSNPSGLTVMPPAWDQYLPTSITGDVNEPKDCDQSSWDSTNAVCKPTTTNPLYSPMYTSAQNHLGPTIFKANSQTQQGCDYNSPGTHTYFLGSPDYEGATPDFTQDVYDEKPLQCVDYLVAQAFCIWDGGRLETSEEWLAAWGTNTTTPYGASTMTDSRGIAYSSLLPKSDLPSSNPVTCTPTDFADCQSGANGCTYPNPTMANPTATTKCDTAHGASGACTCTPFANYTACRFPSATDDLLMNNNPGCYDWTVPDSTHTIEATAYQYNYEFPALVNNDYAVFIAAPGRTLGRAPLNGVADQGAADVIGDLFEITSDITSYNDNPFPVPVDGGTPTGGTNVAWSGNGSWEVHNFVHGANGSYRILDKYGKMGLRCVHN